MLTGLNERGLFSESWVWANKPSSVRVAIGFSFQMFMSNEAGNRLDRIEALVESNAQQIQRNSQQIQRNSQQIGALGDRVDRVVNAMSTLYEFIQVDRQRQALEREEFR